MARRPRLPSLAPLVDAPADPAADEALLADHPLAGEIRRARDVVAGRSSLDEVASLHERVQEGLAEALAQKERWDLLRALAASDRPELARTGRMGLEWLRRQGVIEPIASTPSEQPLLSPLAEALVTRVDRAGEQMLFLVLPSPDGGLALWDALFSDAEGLARLEGYETTRKGWRESRRQLLGTPELALTPLPPPFAHLRIEEEHDRSVARGRGTVEAFADLRLALGVAPRSAREDLTARLPKPFEGRLSDDEAETLAGADLVAYFAPPMEIVRRLELALSEVETSTLFVDDRQRAQAVEAAYGRAIGQWTSGTVRERLAFHAGEAAILAFLRGDSELSSRLRAVADRLATPGLDLTGDRFLFRLLERCIPREPLERRRRPPGAPTRSTPAGLIVPE